MVEKFFCFLAAAYVFFIVADVARSLRRSNVLENDFLALAAQLFAQGVLVLRAGLSVELFGCWLAHTTQTPHLRGRE